MLSGPTILRSFSFFLKFQGLLFERMLSYVKDLALLFKLRGIVVLVLTKSIHYIDIINVLEKNSSYFQSHDIFNSSFRSIFLKAFIFDSFFKKPCLAHLHIFMPLYRQINWIEQINLFCWVCLGLLVGFTLRFSVNKATINNHRRHYDKRFFFFYVICLLYFLRKRCLEQCHLLDDTNII